MKSVCQLVGLPLFWSSDPILSDDNLLTKSHNKDYELTLASTPTAMSMFLKLTFPAQIQPRHTGFKRTSDFIRIAVILMTRLFRVLCVVQESRFNAM
jgi:hypothetical protein